MFQHNASFSGTYATVPLAVRKNGYSASSGTGTYIFFI